MFRDEDENANDVGVDDGGGNGRLIHFFLGR